MKTNNMLGINRILLIICGIALFTVNYFPIWLIELDAPQYPEGLELLIYSDRLAGNVDIINGLNHYIGMKTLHTADFPEFTILPYIITFFSIAFVIAGIWGKRIVGYIMLGLFALFGILAMVDFWQWEYDYGHNLNPEAAIIVPGMTYQPPLIGFKQLLNFGAYSIPTTGGWIFILVGIVVAYCMIREWLIAKKNKTGGVKNRIVPLALLIVSSMITLPSCTPNGPQTINVGVDACTFCKMTISDLRFGSEYVTKKGRVYLFDDMKCMLDYISSNSVNKSDLKAIYLPDFSNKGNLIVASEMQILHSKELKSPMGGNYAAFNKMEDLNTVKQQYPGDIVKWEEISK